MDFLLCGDAAGINIEDMIEHDMKSDYCKDHLLDGSDPYLCAKPVLLSVSYNHVDDALNDSYSEDTKHSDHDASWLQQTVNVNEVHGIIAPENTDPNLLVNPQTGLPVSTSSQVTQTTSLSPGLALGDGSQLGSLGNAIIQAATNNVSENISTLKFISANPSISPQSSPLKSPAIPISTKSSTVQQVTAQPTITYMPATPSTIQNVQKVSHAQSVSSVTYQTLTQHLQNTNSHPHKKAKLSEDSNRFPKPVYSYSCLIAMALKNSDTGALPVSEIYSFMTENFPYFKIAPDGWKNSVRHNLSLNKCFEKIENPKATSTSRKGCLWGLNPAKIEKMDEEIVKWRKKDPMAVKKSMQYPERLETIEKGNLGSHWPHHPNNIKNNYSSHDLSHIMQHSPAVGSPDSSVPSGSSSPGSAPSTPTKTNCVQVSLIEIRPDHAIRTVKLDPAQVIQTSNVLTNAINRASTMSQPIKIEPKIEVQNEMILIKNDPDVIKEEVNDVHDSSREEEDMNLSQTALMDHDIEFAHGIWDELQDEGINLDDLPSSSQFNFSFSTNSLTSSPATVLQV